MRFPNLFRSEQRGAQSLLRERIYAIGDIHGRLDLLRTLLGAIEADARTRNPLPTRLVILGDFIDRGPDSRELMCIFAGEKSGRVVVLKGNHEAALVDALRGDHDALDLWMAHGGNETLRSFGATDSDLDPDDSRALIELARKVIPKSLVNWLEKLPVFYRQGQYYFVHAGVRPGVPLDRQSIDDQLWIRDEFTQSKDNHGAVIVHGHSVNEEGVVFCNNRIGVDTGAYRTELLSAAGLEGDDQWVVNTGSSIRLTRCKETIDPQA
jgi:serine/threonine protein phosphatase 1